MVIILNYIKKLQNKFLKNVKPAVQNQIRLSEFNDGYVHIELSNVEKEVLALLKKVETTQFPVSNWYLGALCAAKNDINPDRYSQAAQSLREILKSFQELQFNFQYGRSFRSSGLN